MTNPDPSTSEMIRRLIYSAAWRVLHNDDDAFDVSQDVLLEAHGYLQSRGQSPGPALLRRMATLRAIDYLRKRRNTEPLEDQLEQAADCQPDLALQQKEQIERIRIGLGNLPSHDAEAFALRYFEGLEIQEISETLGISATAVSSAIHRAKSQLQAMLVKSEALSND